MRTEGKILYLHTLKHQKYSLLATAAKRPLSLSLTPAFAFAVAFDFDFDFNPCPAPTPSPPEPSRLSAGFTSSLRSRPSCRRPLSPRQHR